MNECICSKIDDPTPCRGEVDLHVVPGTDGEHSGGEWTSISGGITALVCEFHFAMMKYSHEHRDELDQVENQR